MTRTSRLLSGLLLVIWPALSLAEIYQWRDAQGRLHFSDKKPAAQEGSAAEISADLTPLNVDESASELGRVGQVLSGETEEETHWREHKAAEAERVRLAREQERRQACNDMSRYLTVLRGRVYFEREDGSTYTISQAEQKRRVQELEAQMDDECSDL